MNESLKTNVNLDVLNGTCCSLFPVVFLTSKARIHSFKASRLLFISAPSARRLLLLLCVALSLPAKSTKVNFAYSSFPFSLITNYINIV